MKRLYAFLAVLIIAHVPISCSDDDASFSTQQATITQLSTTIGTFDSGVFEPVPSTDVELAAIQVIIADMEVATIAARSRPRWSFISGAYAESPPSPEPTQAILSIAITSEASVFTDSLEYAAGEDLTELFQVVGFTFNGEKVSVDDAIALQQQDRFLFGYEGAAMTFQLNDRPDSTINQSFEITYTLSDSAVFRMPTGVFTVSN